jgi:hypothetical protein
MFKITEENYEYYKNIAEVIWNFLWKDIPVEIPEDSLPMNVLNRMEQKSKSLARKGLKEGLMDSFHMLKEASAEHIFLLNQELIKSGLENINRLRAFIEQIPVKVLKRGKIKNLDEYYVIKEVVADTAGPGISEEEREQLNKIFGEFEMKHPKEKKGE